MAKGRRGQETGMKQLPLSPVHQLIEPGQLVMFTTARNGRADVMDVVAH